MVPCSYVFNPLCSEALWRHLCGCGRSGSETFWTGLPQVRANHKGKVWQDWHAKYKKKQILNKVFVLLNTIYVVHGYSQFLTKNHKIHIFFSIYNNLGCCRVLKQPLEPCFGLPFTECYSHLKVKIIIMKYYCLTRNISWLTFTSIYR